MSQCDRIRVLVVHDDPIVQVGLSAIFGRQPDLDVLPDRDAQSARTLLLGPGRCPVDVVVADYAHGIAVAMQLSRTQACKVVIVSAADRECEIRSALASGVHGYIRVGSPLAELATGVRSVHRGARHLCPEIAAKLAESLSVERLTQREEEVLRLVVEGLCNKAIGRRLDIAVGTVKSHLKSVFDKLGVVSRTQAVATVERRGLLCDVPSPAAMVTSHAGRTGAPTPTLSAAPSAERSTPAPHSLTSGYTRETTRTLAHA